MSRWIDANKLKRKVQRVATEAWMMKLTSSVETVLNQFLDYIEEAPSIDLVRCAECRYYRDYDGCFFSTAEVEPDGYCFWGERKESE